MAFSSSAQEPFPHTHPLAWEGDIASRLVEAADAFLLKEIAAAKEKRIQGWSRDAAFLEARRRDLAHMIGAVEERAAFDAFTSKHLLGSTSTMEAFAVRWPAFADVQGEGILLEPTSDPVAQVIVIPDADQDPETLVGWKGDGERSRQWGRLAAEKGCRVLIPTIINRQATHRQLSNREFLYRSAFVLGRHLIGYEMMKVQALVDWCKRQHAESPVIVAGWGEGGLLSLYTAAIDPRIDAAWVRGYFGPRDAVWEEPVYRNVFGLLSQFGDAEMASLIAPRRLVVDPSPSPEIMVPPGTGGKPGRLRSPSRVAVEAECLRACDLSGLGHCVIGGFEDVLPAQVTPCHVPNPTALPDSVARHARQMHELDRHNQQLLVESPYTRKAFMQDLQTESLLAFEISAQPYREYFAEEIIGQFDLPLGDPNPRSRLIRETDRVALYEVVLDVGEDFFLYGILCWPKGIDPGEQRPVVVCQHGLEGRPQMLIGEEGHQYYKAFALRLAERGFVTFAPQHLYLFGDRFRTLQFKANAIKKTLFSLMVPQHQQLTRWLGSLGQVDARRIGFYGLSYGGKSAMRIPPLVPAYCLSICSADFNDWVWKNASSRSPYSYVWTGEYEIFEFNLGSTFNYAEMAALIAPRPFMVERGHADGVAPDERVAAEFAKVRHLYAAQLKLPQHARIAWFDGPHTIDGRETFAFLHEHLEWPVPTD